MKREIGGDQSTADVPFQLTVDSSIYKDSVLFSYYEFNVTIIVGLSRVKLVGS